MKEFIQRIQENYTTIYRYFLFALSVVLIMQLFPRQSSFYWEFHQARPWLYEELIAPFNFAILKTDEELVQERKEALEELKPFFLVKEGVYETQRKVLEEHFDKLWQERAAHLNQTSRIRNKNLAYTLFDTIYGRGIIFLENEYANLNPEAEIHLKKGSMASIHRVAHFFSIHQAYQYMVDNLANQTGLEKGIVRSSLEASLVHSVFLDEETTEKARELALERISPSRGMVQQGEKIVSRGELVTADTYRILNSYRAEYIRQLGNTTINYLVILGQLILVSISMVVLSLFLKTFRTEVFANTRKIMVILLTIYMMIFLTSKVLDLNPDLLYLVPVCIVPIMIRSFFDNRLALYVHIISIILIGFLVPKSFEFVFLQFISGIIAILSMVSLSRRSQLFFTASLVFLTYAAVYTGLSLAQTGAFQHINPYVYLYFAGSALLTLFAYPLIFIFEKTFGLPTDFSLLELSDTNSPLLRELNLNAPGTFQHSLQVANLAEEAINKIGGNSLLVRTGALYHDIGKMDNPHFFIENQNTEINPHDELSNPESASIIIGHVLNGIEKARKNKIPEYIIDFIRTHHGTTTARYFYTMEQKENPGEAVDISLFSYRGPRPFSKETAVLMMADSVEAASRSLKKPDEASISNLIDKIIDTQISEQQFEDANITFKDIAIIKKVFRKRLMHIFHIRMAYPSLN